jgi:hypothetical protein
LEQEIWLKIELETFDDLPLLDIDVKVEKHGNTVVIYFPRHYIERNVYIMVWKDLLHTQTNDHAQLIIKNKNYVKMIWSKWFVLVDYESI